ncbi:ferritin-like domain-containing protein [Streptomyces lacrimifluminis]|uniref:DUF4439 domain-containing protein n=1 Tax=Streptomyces lacrimifluminis TaxID=1500077 RepID=A0A917L756_9ACTN|nr:ferritin-like domain-containing protein [Streptomyces lacrimifluminis]GGJ49059.1 hypothetical protein GCM10012282_52390 [Streptomyces lacrimifluminis]
MTETVSEKAAKDTAELTALQAALGAEHAAVYGYGVVGGLIGEARRSEARAAYDAHRARRDELARAVRALGGTPVAAAAGYALPFPVSDSDGAVRLAAELEERVAGVYSDLVRATGGERRRTGAEGLREAAVRAVRWRGGSVPFPGLAERSGSASAPATASATPTA